MEIQHSCQALPFAVGFVEVDGKPLEDFFVVDVGIFKAGRVDESEVVAVGREIVRLDLGGCCRKNSVRLLASRRRLKTLSRLLYLLEKRSSPTAMSSSPVTRLMKLLLPLPVTPTTAMRVCGGFNLKYCFCIMYSTKTMTKYCIIVETDPCEGRKDSLELPQRRYIGCR